MSPDAPRLLNIDVPRSHKHSTSPLRILRSRDNHCWVQEIYSKERTKHSSATALQVATRSCYGRRDSWGAAMKTSR